MSDARTRLLDLIVSDVGANGLGDRSLRDLAVGVGSSHRMLHYHFGSRSGLVAALVALVEDSQRSLLDELAGATDDPAELAMQMWARVSSPEMRPFARLFFECVAATGGQGLTDPWIETGPAIATKLGVSVDPVELRLGVAVTRGLLIDVLAADDAGPATEAMLRYVALWAGSLSR